MRVLLFYIRIKILIIKVNMGANAIVSMCMKAVKSMKPMALDIIRLLSHMTLVV